MCQEPDYCFVAAELITRACGIGWLPDEPTNPNYDTFLGLLLDIEHHLELGRLVLLQKNEFGVELRAYETKLAKSYQETALYDLRQD